MTVVNKEPSCPPAVSHTPVARWLVWAVLIPIGGTVVVPFITVLVTAMGDDSVTDKLPGFVVFLVCVVAVVRLTGWLQSGFNPISHRTDQMPRWKQQFPAQGEPEIRRFIQLVSGSLGLSKMHICKLSPDDRAADFESLFGGMEVVEILMAVEEEYGVDLSDDVLNTCENLGQLFSYVTRHPTGRPVPAAAGQSFWFETPSQS